MKAKTVVSVLAICFCLLFAPLARADIINLTLYFDWERDGSFNSTSIALDTATQTFTTGDLARGDVRGVIQCLTLIFRTGYCPIYSGPLYGFMDFRADGGCENEPGWWYLGPPIPVHFLNPGERKSDGS